MLSEIWTWVVLFGVLNFLNGYFYSTKDTKIFPLFVCMKTVYYTCIDVAFRYQGQGHLWVKRSSWKKKLYQVYYIFMYLSILLYIDIVIQYYTSLNSP